MKFLTDSPPTPRAFCGSLRSTPVRPCRSAFTLIELLVVVSGIALLVGILLPVLGNAREAGRMSVCLSNTRQMAIAVYNYAFDHDSALPTVGFSHGSTVHAAQGSWFFLLEAYSDGKLHYRCPSDDSVHWTTPDGSGRLRRVSYATNYMLTGFMSSPYDIYNRLDTLSRPSRTVFVGELAEESTSGFATADHFHPETWYANPIDDALVIRQQLEIDQHLERVANYGFVDGHAEALERPDVFEVEAATGNWLKNALWPDVAK